MHTLIIFEVKWMEFVKWMNDLLKKLHSPKQPSG